MILWKALDQRRTSICKAAAQIKKKKFHQMLIPQATFSTLAYPTIANAFVFLPDGKELGAWF